ncbi:hypothetical protein [Vulcanisaeta sp. JCM 16159]|uniref:hypothetical protein n=1 Tax=Vulcanisaeta sp. JCM 16159 TaxID=1295371 RepID=UPI0006D1A3E0|nr:hypothetical protein [Vulcanisaeta sp. JCM 16159]
MQYKGFDNPQKIDIRERTEFNVELSGSNISPFNVITPLSTIENCGLLNNRNRDVEVELYSSFADRFIGFFTGKRWYICEQALPKLIFVSINRKIKELSAGCKYQKLGIIWLNIHNYGFSDAKNCKIQARICSNTCSDWVYLTWYEMNKEEWPWDKQKITTDIESGYNKFINLIITAVSDKKKLISLSQNKECYALFASSDAIKALCQHNDVSKYCLTRGEHIIEVFVECENAAMILLRFRVSIGEDWKNIAISIDKNNGTM